MTGERQQRLPLVGGLVDGGALVQESPDGRDVPVLTRVHQRWPAGTRRSLVRSGAGQRAGDGVTSLRGYDVVGRFLLVDRRLANTNVVGC